MRRYFTTTLPYVNDNPHLGHALEFIHADIMARYFRAKGDNVFLNTGTDEHGLKIYRKAEEAGRSARDYVDDYAARFRSFADRIGMSYDRFIRTTDADHVAAAEEFWRKCERAGDIYKKAYRVRYCVGCELEKTDSELEHGRCPVHPNLAIETIEEENYFFRFSKYRDALLKLYDERPDFVLPSVRMNEIKSFVSRGLEDFSISRLASKMPWGVPVPGDERQVMYVWFDALVNYVSAVGWPQDKAQFEGWWPVTQFAGKDNLRQQSAMWQAMLFSAGLPPSRQIVIHGFLTSGGQKMSKSLGNVIDPVSLMDEYGTDALRYFLARHAHPFEDSDVTLVQFHDAYNANLANGLGNFVARVMTLIARSRITNHESRIKLTNQKLQAMLDGAVQAYHAACGAYHIQNAAEAVWKLIQTGDEYVQETKPWESAENGEVLGNLRALVGHIGDLLAPLMPETAEKIKRAIRENKKPESLFARK